MILHRQKKSAETNPLVQSKNIARDSYVWNMASSLLFGFQSVILLMVLTRTVGLTDSGIFTIAYANASLFLFVGKYGVRNYQVSDVNDEYSFGDYKRARCITVAAMIAISVGYILFCLAVNGYSGRKSWIIFLTCMLKLPDAIEDVYFGEYQRKGRLDIAAKAMTIRLGVTVFTLASAVIITRRLIPSLAVAVIISFVSMFLCIKGTAGIFNLDTEVKNGSVLRILKACFPLFAGSFLAQYIGNAPKYAIDAQLSDELQACYGFIAMPVFVIGLLNNVVFSPIIHRMAEYWKKKDYRAFINRFFVQIGIIGMITLVCLAGAYLVGIPVLSLLYHTDLAGYRSELLILLLGGGFLGLSGLLNTIVTIMRLQKALFWGYLTVSVLALVCSNWVVRLYGMIGAAWLYTVLMGILAAIFAIIFIVGFMRREK